MRVDTLSYVIPASRREGLVVTQLASDLLVYDTDRGELHHLNETVAAVWNLCDGQQRLSDLARETSESLATAIDEGAIRLALTQLADAHLLAGALPEEMRIARMSRRSLARKAAIAGAVVAPALISTTVPTAAQSASTPVLCDTRCSGYVTSGNIFCGDVFDEECFLCLPTGIPAIPNLPDGFFGWRPVRQIAWLLRNFPTTYTGLCINPILAGAGISSRQAQPDYSEIVANELLAIIMASAPEPEPKEEQRSVLQSTSDEGDDEGNQPVSGDSDPTPTPEPTAIPEPTTAPLPTEAPDTTESEPEDDDAPEDGDGDQDESGT